VGDNEKVNERAQARKRAGSAVAGDTDAAVEGRGDVVARRAQRRAEQADEYHARHAEWVAEFNALTDGECAGGPGGVTWAAVRAWQQRRWQVNGLLADGLVGPKTLEAARIVAQQARGAAASDGGASARGDGGASERGGGGAVERGGGGAVENASRGAVEHGSDGRVDAAEAAADKPRLDDEGGDFKAQPAPATGGAHGTLAEFERALAAIDELLAQFRPPRAPAAPAASDGKSAPPTGMLSDRSLHAYQAAVQKILESGHWRSLTPRQRGDELVAAANHALATEHVPPLKPWKPLDKAGGAGMFDARYWRMQLSTALLGKQDLDDEARRTASDVFHEARHAEQRFNMARLLVRQHPTAETAEMLGIPIHVVEVAKDAGPLAANSPEAEAAQKFVDDAVTNKDEHRSLERLAPAVTDAGNRAVALFDSLAPEERAAVETRWNACRARMHEVLDAYHGLATEHDAEDAEKRLAATGARR
jgi:hypothetical protein